jgi:outer membrane protein OmpA-like peptidoglycan-associated protein
MTLVRTLFGASLFTAGLSVATASCGGPSQVSCGAERWEGQCQLKSVVKIRSAEFPAPHVVLEVLFAPLPNAQYPNFTPPELREEIQVMANQEIAARDHLERHSPSQCRMQPPPPDTCVPGKLAVNMPPFQATGVDTVSGPTGCAQIENHATQDRVRNDLGASETLPEFLVFTDGSAEIGGDSAPIVQALASKLGSASDVECVAVVGQIAIGEEHALAQQRAQAVKDALVAAGVDGARMMTIAVTQNVFGAGTERIVDPKARKVTLRIVLRKH